MMKNNFLKLMSVVIAIGIWIMVALSQVQTVVVSVPVKLLDVPKSYIAVPSQKSVSATVKGPAKLIQNMQYTSILLDIDVSTYPAGDSSRRILPSDFRTPLGVEVIEVEPRSVNITVDHMATKTVKIVPTFIGDVRRGFSVESVTTSPKEVTVEGVRSKLRNLESIATSPVNLSDIDTSSVFPIGFKAEDGITLIKPDNIEVRVKLRADTTVREFKSVAVSCEGLDKKFAMKGSPVLQSIKISARRDLADTFVESSRFIVDCSQITSPGKYSGVVGYQTTVEGVEVMSVTPQKINFEIVTK